MTRTMYDAVSPRNILLKDQNPQMVAGYLNGKYAWKQSDWDLFPHAIHVGISVRADFLSGHVLDVEIGDATPAQSVDWVLARRAAGADPSVYCNASTWPSVIVAFAARQVALPHWWGAHYDQVATLDSTPGAVAKQHSGDVPPGIDISVVADYWPGVDGVGPAPSGGGSAPGNPDTEDPMRFDAGPDVHETIFVKGKTQLYVCTADLGDTPVMLTSVDFYGDTPHGPGSTGVGGALRSQQIDPHRPGPLPIPAGAVMAQIRYTANHAFAVGLA
jgi:hypothetical protein